MFCGKISFNVGRLCGTRSSARVSTLSMSVDHSSLSNYAEIGTKSAHYDLAVDFASRSIAGSAKVTLAAKKKGVRNAIFDTRALGISKVTSDGKLLQYKLDEQHKVLGSPLVVTLPRTLEDGEEVVLDVQFSTSPSSTALQWLDPSQTAGGTEPYLFSQCQAIHARSFVPCQDSPSVKSPYTASVSVPAQLKALMSANLVSEEGASDPARPGARVYSFKQDCPIPSYLLALAVGQLESRTIGPRSKVWSEPSQVDAAAYEFQDTAAFLQAGEEIAGPYVWGQYDLLLLPPSFPYGGMENPCLTFCTPTLIAGDRSLVNVVAHEIAHSWTGNLVSNETWQDFWLNEGWTVFLERRILGKLKGPETEQFHASQGYLALQDSVEHFGQDHPFTQLLPDLSGGLDPDDAFSKVPYERGFYFLYYLQSLVGGPKAFNPFMRAYIDRFKFGTVNSQQFKAFFLNFYKGHARLAEIDWQTWYYGRGMPPAVNSFDPKLADRAYDLANRWHLADVMGIGGRFPAGASENDLAGWGSEQVVAFLEKLGQLRGLQPLHSSTSRKLAELYGLDASQNAEIRAAWYKLAINAGDAAVLPQAAAFLKSQGRMKYLRPLYRALHRSLIGKQVAARTFEEAKSSYHPIAAKMVAADLGLSAP